MFIMFILFKLLIMFIMLKMLIMVSADYNVHKGMALLKGVPKICHTVLGGKIL